MQSEHYLYQKAAAMQTELSSWRQHLHKYPERSFQEENTAAFVEKELRRISGMEVFSGEKDTGLNTGVIGILKKGNGPAAALRADMDALPIQEDNDTSYRSVHNGVMHACGHDAHTAMLLGAARLLAEESSFEGTVKFIFQPAEEMTDRNGKSGAPYMIQHGILQDVSVAFALHMDPEYLPGTVRLHEGPSMANVDTFQAEILGTGGHGAYPHLGTDPLWILSFVIQAVQGITSRKTSPLSPSVISIGEVKAGSSTNVIPDQVRIQGTIRSYDQQTRLHLEQELEQAFSIVEAMGGTYHLQVDKGEPALQNDKMAVHLFDQTLQTIFPDYSILRKPYGLGGEDFGYMAEKVPAAMLFLGAGFENSQQRGLHMSRFDLEEEMLPVGASLLAGTALQYFQHNEKNKEGSGM
ncbi:M20 metallopeptidase family protein [Salibacterium qingdaonense]|uniref:Amidohydrolase n=1 Tax=Salibacterium qingdaonense TaxID=266892 RepID=A0A1I4K0E5_9BACI|nr:amidohydrolase [Salibacterium qingdaonense]SFL72278.1 amidohydrolase [Salibacterium qingdaonense]